MFTKFFKMHFKKAMQYKLNTLFLSISGILINLSEILAIFILFSNFSNVKYWGFYETMLIFGVITTVFSFIECFFRGYDEFDKVIKTGDLDRILVRPVNIYKQIFYNEIAFHKVGRIILGLALTIIAALNMSINWTFTKIVVLIAMFVGGSLVVMGIILITAGITVFSVERLEFLNVITQGTKEVGYYPLNIYNKWFQRIFTFVIPLACFNYLPMNYIIGAGTMPRIIYALSPLVGIVFIIPCFLFFAWSLKHYKSTGT